MEITLYQAAQDLRETLDQIDPETGELPEGFESARAIVEKKGVSVAAYMLNENASIAMLEARAKELMDAAKRRKRRIEWLRGYLADNMAATGILKIEGPDFIVKLERERDASVDVFQPELLPPDYMREKVTIEPDKTLIKKALSEGYDVPGARIIKKDRLTMK